MASINDSFHQKDVSEVADTEVQRAICWSSKSAKHSKVRGTLLIICFKNIRLSSTTRWMTPAPRGPIETACDLLDPLL